MKPTQKSKILGIMSGTSLDGLDLAFCCFEKSNGGWKYLLKAATTVPYPETMQQRLANAFDCSALEITRLDIELGRFIASSVIIISAVMAYNTRR